MAKKKINGLSIAIIAINILIVGIIILLVVLVYLHMKQDIDNGRGGSTATTTTEPAPDDDGSQSAGQTVLPSTNYDEDFFANDLFIGDSISTGLYTYEYLDKYNVFAEMGLNPESALTKEVDGMTVAQRAALMQPRNIYIMLGTNGLSFMEGSYMRDKLVELIAQLEASCPNASIYVITIPPVTAAHNAEGVETMEKVNGYNSLLKEMCSDNGYNCIDLCTLLQDKDGYLSASYAEQDGMHFLSFAYMVMLSYVQKCAE